MEGIDTTTIGAFWAGLDAALTHYAQLKPARLGDAPIFFSLCSRVLPFTSTTPIVLTAEGETAGQVRKTFVEGRRPTSEGEQRSCCRQQDAVSGLCASFFCLLLRMAVATIPKPVIN